MEAYGAQGPERDERCGHGKVVAVDESLEEK